MSTKELQKQIVILNRENIELKSQIEILTQKNTKLEKEIKTSDNLIQRHSADILYLRAIIGIQQKDYNDLQKDFNNLQKDFNNLQKEYKDLQKVCNALRVENTDLKKQLFQLKTHMADFKAEALLREEEANQKINDLKKEMTFLKKSKKNYSKIAYNKVQDENQEGKKLIVFACSSAIANYYLQYILLPSIKKTLIPTPPKYATNWIRFRAEFDKSESFKKHSKEQFGVDLDKLRKLKNDRNDEVNDGEDLATFREALKIVQEFKNVLPTHLNIINTMVIQIQRDLEQPPYES
ncbi:hypothetical protein DLAC_06079 [Tieghemostelium lacteum]|uniref:Uncharacterized protein n=1 Tax=Tieghemostelium lacteum TaxID=361077 RepID=A0A151ZHF2_TIELA|nr:hypothetical protein DLAC_06079 [Tieghemostelium lacteum]|eukprot:KYQ93396.1 hypothetical protein DLAC_06079 [Tieghemostelium lacteum]